MDKKPIEALRDAIEDILWHMGCGCADDYCIGHSEDIDKIMAAVEEYYARKTPET